MNKQLSSQRLDKVLVSKLEGYSRTQIKTLILNGNVSLNGKEIKDPSYITCLLYTSPSPRDGLLSRMPSSA